jgi:polyhydroxyalkanoate synthase
MILRTEIVDQAINRERRGMFIKDVVMTDGADGLGMVRKRRADLDKTRGTVLLIHGFGQNRYTWHTSRRSFSNHLADQGFDVFNADLRGHGRSRRFGRVRPRLFDEYVLRDLPLFVEEAKRLSGHDEVFLIGHSMGGLISYCGAASGLRNSLRGIVSIGSPYRFGLGSLVLDVASRVGNALRVAGVLNSNPTVPLRSVARVLGDRLAVWDSPFFFSPLRAWVPKSVEDDVMREYLRRAFDQASLSTMLAIFRTGRYDGVHSEDGFRDYGIAFEQVDIPLLVVAGTKDRIVPPASVRPAYERSRSTDKSYREFPLGHVDLIVGRDAPATVWASIADWLTARA